MTTVRKTKMLPPVWLALALVAMALLDRFAPGARIVPPPWRWLGLVPIVAGVALAMSGVRLFRRHGTGVVPFTPVTHLVVAGPYRFTRNPMYLGMVLLLGGAAVMFGSATPWLVIPLFAFWIDRRFIAQEEVMLEEAFGTEYAAFRKRVPRWV